MGSPDCFNEIATSLLFTDAELGLTFVRVGLSYPEGVRREMLIHHAQVAYHQISELKFLVQMTDADRRELIEKLEELHTELQQAGINGYIASPPS